MFKFIIICLLLATAHAERRGFGHARATYTHTASKAVSASSDDYHAQVLSAAADVRPDGFDHHLETSNGISSKASGDDHGRIHGDYQWISPEGEHIALSYVADENGYRPNSALLPTPPPIPEAILKSLKYLESHPYHEENDHHHQHQQHQHQQHHHQQHHQQQKHQHNQYHHNNRRF